jgi:hypothetical protein
MTLPLLFVGAYAAGQKVEINPCAAYENAGEFIPISGA